MTECERLQKEGIIPPDFLKEEVRDGYKVTSEMKKVWAIEIDLLLKLIDCCKKNNLKIWVCYGTLLGAVRHKGMIPWDDDIDVYMPRDDYNKLLSLDPEYMGKPYFIQSPYSDPKYFRSFARFRNSNTAVIEDPKNPRVPPYNSGIYLDIFPLDGMDAPLATIKRRNSFIKFISTIGHAYSVNINPNPVLRIMNKLLHLPFVPFKTKWLFTWVKKIASKEEWEITSKVGMNIHIPYPIERCIFDKEDFKKTIWLPFEFFTVPVPAGYDNILRISYGDYRKFPPVDKRGLWHSFVFQPDIPYTSIAIKK
mgnify:CR=1 FL=1